MNCSVSRANTRWSPCASAADRASRRYTKDYRRHFRVQKGGALRRFFRHPVFYFTALMELGAFGGKVMFRGPQPLQFGKAKLNKSKRRIYRRNEINRWNEVQQARNQA